MSSNYIIISSGGEKKGKYNQDLKSFFLHNNKFKMAVINEEKIYDLWPKIVLFEYPQATITPTKLKKIS